MVDKHHGGFNRPSILFTEDKKSAAGELRSMLRRYFEIYYTTDGLDALRLYEARSPDIVLTDVDLTGIDGFELIRYIRERERATPVIALSARRDERLLLMALKFHLEDYLLKPVRCSELIAALNRCAKYLQSDFSAAALSHGAFYSYRSKEIVHPDRRIALTHKEILLLELLLSRRQCVVYYSEIEAVVWDGDMMSIDALKSVVKKIRKKLPEGSITNIIGVGYKFA